MLLLALDSHNTAVQISNHTLQSRLAKNHSKTASHCRNVHLNILKVFLKKQHINTHKSTKGTCHHNCTQLRHYEKKLQKPHVKKTTARQYHTCN